MSLLATAGRGTKQDLSPALDEDTLALPCTQQAARSEWGDVGFVGKFLIPDVEFDSSWNLLTDSLGEVGQYSSEPLWGGIADQRGVYRPITCKVIKGD